MRTQTVLNCTGAVGITRTEKYVLKAECQWKKAARQLLLEGMGE
jgi:hypothetical protein